MKTISKRALRFMRQATMSYDLSMPTCDLMPWIRPMRTGRIPMATVSAPYAESAQHWEIRT